MRSKSYQVLVYLLLPYFYVNDSRVGVSLAFSLLGLLGYWGVSHSLPYPLLQQHLIRVLLELSVYMNTPVVMSRTLYPTPQHVSQGQGFPGFPVSLPVFAFII